MLIVASSEMFLVPSVKMDFQHFLLLRVVLQHCKDTFMASFTQWAALTCDLMKELLIDMNGTV